MAFFTISSSVWAGAERSDKTHKKAANRSFVFMKGPLAVFGG
jgi:hypothetical protein